MNNAKTQALLVVEQIPLFCAVGPENAVRIVQACEVRHFDAGRGSVQSA